MKIENWSIQNSRDTVHIAGMINEEKGILTSPIIGKDSLNRICTKNSAYTLGEVDPQYESAYPNAKQRLLDSLARLYTVEELLADPEPNYSFKISNRLMKARFVGSVVRLTFDAELTGSKTLKGFRQFIKKFQSVTEIKKL